MQRCSRQITLVLIGAVTLLPGCKNSKSGAEDSFDSSRADSSRADARRTSGTRSGYYGRGGVFVPVPIGGVRTGTYSGANGGPAGAPNAAVSGAQSGGTVDAPAPSRARGGFGSTGSSRGGGFFS